MTWAEIADAADARYHADVVLAEIHRATAALYQTAGGTRAMVRHELAAVVYAACARGERALAALARRMEAAGR